MTCKTSNDTPNTEEMQDLQEWGWDSFKAMFDGLKATSGDRAAWKAIHFLWQRRAGEIEFVEGAEYELNETNNYVMKPASE